jgi:hypothetical protein
MAMMLMILRRDLKLSNLSGYLIGGRCSAPAESVDSEMSGRQIAGHQKRDNSAPEFGNIGICHARGSLLNSEAQQAEDTSRRHQPKTGDCRP